MRVPTSRAVQPSQSSAVPGAGHVNLARPGRASTSSSATSISLHALWHAASTPLAAGLCAAMVLASATGGAAAADALAQPVERHIEACRPSTSCVSTSSFMSPSQYLPPWSFRPQQRPDAQRRLVQELQAAGGTVSTADAGEGYIAADMPFMTSFGQKGTDHIEFQLRPDGVALFRSQSASSTPDPPFCFTRGCISGPRNRARMEAFRDERLGWAPLETDEDKRWVQILMH